MTKSSRFSILRTREGMIALLAISGIFLYLVLRYGYDFNSDRASPILLTVLFLGGIPLVLELVRGAFRGKFSSDLLAGISIVTSIVLGEYLAGAIVVLMLSGGEALETLAVKRASDVLNALVKRMPTTAHRKNGAMVDIPLEEVVINDALVVYPHEVCPVDGIVIDGHGSMDESYLTGEPYQMSKAPGAAVLSGAINGEAVLTIRASRKAVDSRYAKIVEVMKRAEVERPRIRRLGDSLGAYYTPLALITAIVAAYFSGDPHRFLAVLVVATPCPLLIAIPICIIGSISLAAKRSIIIRDPAVLEQVELCSTIILDKTGTLTYGEPIMTEQLIAPGADRIEVLRLVASLEQYSKHPLAKAIIKAAKGENIQVTQADSAHEPPGQGLTGSVNGRKVTITNRKNAILKDPSAVPPITESGLECCVLVDDRYVATYRFHDAPRTDSKAFIKHLGSRHQFKKVMIVSGDRLSEVQYLAAAVGVTDIHASKSPEEKVEIVRAETAKNKTLFVGDGVNDAPALMSATVGIAFGQNSDITAQAAGVVVLDPTLKRVDEFFHIGRRMRNIALQSAVGGMILSMVGMYFAAVGVLPPVHGAIAQELIDIFAILNALRTSVSPHKISDIS